MDIPNLSHSTITKTGQLKPLIIVFIVIGALSSGFALSRFFPTSTTGSSSFQPGSYDSVDDSKVVNPESLKSNKDIAVGQTYGNTGQNFKDSATGVIESGSINGEGTHILNREGGVTQRAALTSSVLDLDLFVGRKVEVKGETNSSKKAGWLMDVGIVKVLE